MKVTREGEIQSINIK